MADGQESYSVPFEKLNGSNWEEWSRKLKAWLVAKGLWEATQGPPQQASAGAAAAVVAAAQASQRKDQEALGAIVLSLEGSQLPLVEGLDSAQVVWQELERVCRDTTAEAKSHVPRCSTASRRAAGKVGGAEKTKGKFAKFSTGCLCDEEERRLREGRDGQGALPVTEGGPSQKAQFRLFPLVVVLSAGLLTICVGPVRGELERPGRMSLRSLPMAVSQVLVAASQVSMAASLGEEASVGMQREDVTEEVRRTVLLIT
ncbi:Hypothetical predicted protein [Podarcis lilfordi]|uniref:DUF4219 domain-containing protein n=1 Tax=Podarcis lilfordi TaxID=74358 RepID=A0AA35NWH2_9SAUR|nr:Hypothetical predicted protein [Podarcis lilfordi]